MIFYSNMLCFVCITRFFLILIALVLSQYMTSRSLISIFIPSNSCLNQTMLEQLTTTTTTYSSSIVNWEIQFCILLVKDTSLLPRKNAPPLVLFLSSRLPTQSTLVNTFKYRLPLIFYYKPYSLVAFRYFMILLIVIIWFSLGFL